MNHSFEKKPQKKIHRLKLKWKFKVKKWFMMDKSFQKVFIKVF